MQFCGPDKKMFCTTGRLSMALMLARYIAGGMVSLFFLVGLTACELYRPAEVVPSYIRIDTFSFQDTVPDDTGYPTQRITEVWVYARNNLVGIFTLPTGRIPILSEGPTDLQIQAGVFTDGVRKSRVSYRFYEQYTEKAVLKKGQETLIRPRFRYPDRLKKPFAWYQDFESADTGYFRGEKGTVAILRETHLPSVDENLFGRRFARMRTVTDADVAEFRTQPFILLPTQSEVFLELDYKSTCNIEIGVTGQVGGRLIGSAADLRLVPRDTWTKVYVSLGEETGLFHSETFIERKPAYFQVYIRTPQPPGAGQEVSLDNLKLIR
jgi:hypothetical protein